MQVEVTDADRELFITTLNPDSSTAEAVRKGFSYTWEVEQIARHRIAERERVVGEIVAWLRKQDDPEETWSLQNSHWYADQIEAGDHLK